MCIRDSFETGQKPTGRIISLAKPYLRPIVRGKHYNKSIENESG